MMYSSDFLYEASFFSSNGIALGYYDTLGGPSTAYFALTNNNIQSGDNLSFNISDPATYVVPCYLRGTRILTRRGKVAVEDLQIGDEVLTLSHEFQPIKWIGKRTYAQLFISKDRKADVLPIRIRKGALGHGVPHRDLYVSPGHALYFEDTLIPASALVNGLSVTQVEDIEQIDYFHILLDRHDVVWAEGAAAESYEIHGNLKGFANWAEYAEMCGGEPTDDPRDCFPRRVEGPVHEKVRAALLERAEVIGFTKSFDPALHVLADGVAIEPFAVEGRRYTFNLSTPPSDLRLTSRSTLLSELHGHGDERRLGVPLQRLILRSTGITVEIGPDHPALVDGFSYSEGTHRWTDGNAHLPQDFFACLPDGPVMIEVHLGESTIPYYVAPVDEASVSQKSAKPEPLAMIA